MKVALVTGGSRGIGLAIVKRLYQDGFSVAAVGTKEMEAEDARYEGLSPDRFLYVAASIAESDDRIRIVRSCVEKFGRIDVLVNNAGVAPLERKPLLEMSEESFDRVVGVNTKGNMFLTQLVARQMLSQKMEGKKRGTIVNISSCSADVVSTSRGEYCVSKAGVSMLTKLYASALAGDGILVHEVRPGVIATDMTSAVKAKYDALIGNGVFPIKRWGTPEDVASAVSMFASDTLLYTTGNYIDVDGGFHLQSL
jgi:3-oxoacyl-[acyl-carrier protein] reductase